MIIIYAEMFIIYVPSWGQCEGFSPKCYTSRFCRIKGQAMFKYIFVGYVYQFYQFEQIIGIAKDIEAILSYGNTTFL